jgi:hypothetical protein
VARKGLTAFISLFVIVATEIRRSFLAFAVDASLRTCRHCGSVYPALDLRGFRCSEVAREIAVDLAAA